MLYKTVTLDPAHRSDWEENCVADARQVRVLGVCWGAGKIPKRLEVLVPRVNPTGLDGWEKIKVRGWLHRIWTLGSPAR